MMGPWLIFGKQNVQGYWHVEVPMGESYILKYWHCHCLEQCFSNVKQEGAIELPFIYFITAVCILYTFNNKADLLQKYIIYK